MAFADVTRSATLAVSMSDDFPIGSRFVIGRRVGHGASGEVLRATDRVTGQEAAIKRLHAVLDDAVSIDRFRREARLLAQINHPHVVRYLAHGVDDEGRACLAVEWLEGEDLAKRQRRDPLPLGAALEIVGQVARGLSALHRAGVVHRDVKPANIVLREGEGGALHATIIDLGVARGVSEATMTAHGIAIGTPSYMAPEQARGDDRVTHHADQFSLGVVLFELITGKKPFVANNTFAMLAKIVLAVAPKVSELVPGAPPEIDAFMRRALGKAPHDRFADILEFAAALGRIPAWDGAAAAAAGEDEPTARMSLVMSAAFEQRVVTVLFAGGAHGDDAVQFTSIVEEHGGTSFPTIGGRWIAVFGGDRTLGDEPIRAARAALAAAARAPRLRLSIATGRALSGTSGLTGDLFDRGAVDDRENSLENKPIVIDQATAQLAQDHFVIDDEGGKRTLVGPRRAAAPPRAIGGRSMPCVGRDRELSNLEAAFRECAAEPVARAVIVIGAPGAGKSRLRHELTTRLARAERPPEVLLCRGGPLAEASPFGMIAPALRRFAGILEGEPTDDRAHKLTARLRGLVPEGAIEKLVELAGLAPSSPRPRRDAMVEGDMLRAAFVAWLEAECAARPLALVIEDAQWGDVASIGLVDAALRALAERPLFVLTLARPEIYERFPSLFAARGAEEMRLGPLLPRAATWLARAALGEGNDAIVERIVARAEGNPFFLEELVRAAAAGDAEVPDTVLGMVQARLDALGPDRKRILRAASVFGLVFRQSGVASLLGEEPSAIADLLRALAAEEVIARRAEACVAGDEEYVFHHALVREAAYAMVPEIDRVVGHRAAGAFLERERAAGPAVIAAHFARGGALDRAAALHLAAAGEALSGNDFAGAIAHAEHSITGSANDLDRGAARLIQAEAHRWRGEMEPAGVAGAEAAALLARGSPEWFHAVREVIAANGRQGYFDVVRVWAMEAITCDAPPSVAGAQIACLVPAAVHFTYAGESAEANRVVNAIDAIARTARDLDPTVSARLHQLRAIRADRAANLDAALAHHESALAAFERAGDVRAACLTLSNLGYVRMALGAIAEAEEALVRARASAERMGLTTVSALAAHNLGGVLAALGRLDEARAIEARAVEAFVAAGDPRLEGASRVYLARILQAMGDREAALAEVQRVATSPLSPPPLRAGALAVLGDVLLDLGRAGEALAAASEAAALLESLGTVEDFEALIGIVHVEALARAGRAADAKAALVKAWSRIVSRASKLGDRARDPFLKDVPDNARCAALARAYGVVVLG